MDFVKFYIRDKKLTKRTALQQLVAPLFVYNANQTVIPRPGSMEQVYVPGKFAIPDNKNLVMEMFERGGGRHLTFNVSNEDILKAHELKRRCLINLPSVPHPLIIVTSHYSNFRFTFSLWGSSFLASGRTAK